MFVRVMEDGLIIQDPTNEPRLYVDGLHRTFLPDDADVVERIIKGYEKLLKEKDDLLALKTVQFIANSQVPEENRPHWAR